MQKLDNNVKYSFTSEETFRNELDNVHTFVMKNYKIGMHVQDFFEINIITNGRGKHCFEDNVVDADVISELIRYSCDLLTGDKTPVQVAEAMDAIIAAKK